MKANQQNEQKKQLYVMIRRIHLLEMVYNFDWINKQEYEGEVESLVKKYHNLKSILVAQQGFDLNKFLRDYNILEQAKIVDIVCDRNDAPGGSKKNDLVLFMEATATFIKVNDILSFNQTKPIVVEIQPAVGQLVFLMRKLKGKLSKEFATKVQNLERLYAQLEKKKPQELLSQYELKELQIEIQALYRMMELDAVSKS